MGAFSINLKKGGKAVCTYDARFHQLQSLLIHHVEMALRYLFLKLNESNLQLH